MPDAKSSFETGIPERINADPDRAKSIGAIFVFKITGDGGGTWTVDLKNDVGVREGEAEGADCTLELNHDDWKSITENPSAAMGLFFQGRIKVSGNPMLATKLQEILG